MTAPAPSPFLPSPEEAQAPFRRIARRTARLACAVALGLLAACGGGGGSDIAGSVADIEKAGPSTINSGALDPSLLMMLVPDGLPADDPRIAAWKDAASEQGIRLLPVTDSQFAALGDNAFGYAGLVLPDDLHAVATDATVANVKNYVQGGGSVMLTFDFAALALRDDGAVVYPIPRSRLSDLAGVEYVLYDELRDRTTGIGPVVSVPSTLRALQVPPGKSMPYNTAPALTVAAKTASPAEALYLPVSTDDPGGVRKYDPQQFQNLRNPTAIERSNGRMRSRSLVDFGRAVRGPKVKGVTPARPTRLALTVSEPDNTSEPSTPGAGNPAPAAAAAPQATLLAADLNEPLHAYTGYLIGELQYPTYVTRGAYAGQTLASSPNFGLVAGLHTFGQGRVLFVNLPLTYLKGRTDALPMHGFLGYFAQQVLKLPQLSSMPNGIGGMVLNWHLDAMEAQAPSLALERNGVFNRGPFSINMTAGPDTVVIGDGLGWNLDNNTTAQALLRRLRDGGHSIGSHGGWIHDYFGLNATEANQAEFEPFITMNMASVDAVVGMAGREYSAPQGNNPLWAMNYIESRGVVGAYFGGHTGLGGTRHYREGVLLNPGLSVFPVTPNGLYATFEEFQEFTQTKESVVAWYRSMVDFNIEWNTNRLVYAHPAGANAWRDVLNNMLNYAANKGNARFRWYTMPQLADFMANRRQVQWTETLRPDRSIQFTAAHPSSLQRMVWRLPKSRFQQPVIASTTATLTENTSYWLVRARDVRTLSFTAAQVP